MATRRQGQNDEYIHVVRHLRSRLRNEYPRVAFLIPDFLIRSYLVLDTRIPLVRELRLRWKQFSQR